MAQHDDAAAVAEAPVVDNAADNSIDTTVDTEQALYEDDQAEPDLEEQREDEGGDLDPVEAPASLKAEEKEQFSQLPPEAQRFAADLLARRDRETQQGLEAARSAQRQAETGAADHAARIQQQFAAQAAQLVQAFQPTPPPIELARENPAQYQYEKALYDENLGTFQELVGHIVGLNNQSEQHFGAQRQNWLNEQANQLRSIPEFADDAQRPEFQRAIADLAMSEGSFTVEELNQADAKQVMFLHKARGWKADAEKWRAHKAKRNERPRQAQGRFAAAPSGNGTISRGGGVSDTLKALYPND